MGNFLALSSVISKSSNEVVNSLSNYTISVGGGLQKEDNINSDTPNGCIVKEANGNTSVFYPDGYLEWDNTAEYISKELHATVFSFHIHDGTFWMYILYHNGKIVDQFNPVPDYWDEDLSKEELKSWKGNAQVITDHVPYIKAGDINKYLVRWDLDEEDPAKAYPSDEFAKEDWQLMDFMKKLKLPYPIDDNGNPEGQTYKIWTAQLELETNPGPGNKRKDAGRPWWKFW